MINLSDRTSGIEPLVANPSLNLRTYQKKVLIVCPWQKYVSPMTAFCVAQLTDKRRTSTMLNYGDAFVAHTRNACADHFLKSSLEWMITIDDDMVVPFGNSEWYKTYTGWANYPEPFASFNTIDRLMSHEKTLVGAIYFGKHPTGCPVFCEGGNKQEAEYVRRGPHDLCKPTKWVGTGCMLIHRSVFEDIEKKFPNLSRMSDRTGKGQWFSSSEHTIMDWVRKTRTMLSDGPMTSEKAFKAYEMLTAAEADAKAKSSLAMGEDVAFCIRAREAGHQPYVDLGLICGHTGTQVFGPHNTGLK
jgi:hypothetical protein